MLGLSTPPASTISDALSLIKAVQDTPTLSANLKALQDATAEHQKALEDLQAEKQSVSQQAAQVKIALENVSAREARVSERETKVSQAEQALTQAQTIHAANVAGYDQLVQTLKTQQLQFENGRQAWMASTQAMTEQLKQRENAVALREEQLKARQDRLRDALS